MVRICQVHLYCFPLNHLLVYGSLYSRYGAWWGVTLWMRRPKRFGVKCEPEFSLFGSLKITRSQLEKKKKKFNHFSQWFKKKKYRIFQFFFYFSKAEKLISTQYYRSAKQFFSLFQNITNWVWLETYLVQTAPLKLWVLKLLFQSNW